MHTYTERERERCVYMHIVSSAPLRTNVRVSVFCRGGRSLDASARADARRNSWEPFELLRLSPQGGAPVNVSWSGRVAICF